MARCGCGARDATGCLTLLDDSDCFTVSGDGSEATPYTISPDLDASGTNLFTCSATGLLAQLPAIIASPPAVQAFKTRNTSVANNTMTAISYNHETYDTDTMFSTGAATRITFTTAGIYIVTFYGLWDNNPTGNRVAQIRKNGADILAYESKPAGGTDLFVGHCLVVQDTFAAADYVEAMVLQTSGAALDLQSDKGSPTFSAEGR